MLQPSRDLSFPLLSSLSMYACSMEPPPPVYMLTYRIKKKAFPNDGDSVYRI